MLSSALPIPVQRDVARALASVQFRWSPSRRDAVLANLERIAAAGYPSLADPAARVATARRMFEAHHRGWLEYLSRAGTGRRAARTEYQLSGTEHLYRAIATGRGAVLTVPHLGNWEMFGPALTNLGLRVHTVTGVQLHRSVAREIRALKARDGIEVSTPQDGFVPLLGALRRGSVVALMADGDVFSRSVPAEFFGARVPFPAGPAILARRAHAPIVHGHAVRTEDGGHRITFDGVDEPDPSLGVREDLGRLTACVARSLERSIAANVTQWCIFRSIWSADVA
ncbi:MAG: lysophospholipid acyltransferase family protein [Candidatus Eiseniibacteriota bacterium]